MLPLGLFPWISAGWGKGSPPPHLSFCNFSVTWACLLGGFFFASGEAKLLELVFCSTWTIAW